MATVTFRREELFDDQWYYRLVGVTKEEGEGDDSFSGLNLTLMEYNVVMGDICISDENRRERAEKYYEEIRKDGHTVELKD